MEQTCRVVEDGTGVGDAPDNGAVEENRLVAEVVSPVVRELRMGVEG